MHFLNLLSDRPMLDIDVHVLHLLAHSLHVFHGDVIGTLLEHSLYELLNPNLVLCKKPEYHALQYKWRVYSRADVVACQRYRQLN